MDAKSVVRMCYDLRREANWFPSCARDYTNGGITPEQFAEWTKFNVQRLRGLLRALEEELDQEQEEPTQDVQG